MRVKLVALIVLAAIMLGAGAAGTPVNGDDSVAATTAGINLGSSTPVAPRLVAPPPEQLRASLARLLLLVRSAGQLLVPAAEPFGQALRWSERRASRGPPLVRVP